MASKNNYKQYVNKYIDISQFGNGSIKDIDIMRILHIYKKIIKNNQKNYNLISLCKHNTLYCCITEPDVTLYEYIHRIMNYTKVTGWEICYGFVLLSKFIKIKRLDFQECMKFKLFLISAYIGNKFCSDTCYNTYYWSKCGGVKIKELVDIEINFLKVIDYRCFIKPSEIISLLVVTEIIGNQTFNIELIKNENERIENNAFDMPYTSLIKTFKNYKGSYDYGFNSYENIEKLIKLCDDNDETNIYRI
jgi:hypothetical protein